MLIPSQNFISRMNALWPTQPRNQSVHSGRQLTVSRVAKYTKEFFSKLLHCMAKPFRGDRRLVIGKHAEEKILAEVYRDQKFRPEAPVQEQTPYSDWVILDEEKVLKSSWEFIEPAPAEPVHQRWQYFRSDSMEFIRAARESANFEALKEGPDTLRALHATFDSLYAKEFNGNFSTLRDKTPDEAISADLLEVGRSAVHKALGSIASPEYKAKMQSLSRDVFAAMRALHYSPQTHTPVHSPVLTAPPKMAQININRRTAARLTLR